MDRVDQRLIHARRIFPVSALFYQMVRPMPMFPVVALEQGTEQEVSPNPRKKEINIYLLSLLQMASKDMNRQEHDEQETAAEGPTEIPPDHESDESDDGYDRVLIGPGESVTFCINIPSPER